MARRPQAQLADFTTSIVCDAPLQVWCHHAPSGPAQLHTSAVDLAELLGHVVESDIHAVTLLIRPPLGRGAPPVAVTALRTGELLSSCEDYADYIADIARRMLGCATPAPQHCVAEWTLAAWLDLCLHRCADPQTSRSFRTWHDLARLHPGWLADCDEPECLGSAMALAAQEWTWGTLRRGLDTGRVNVVDLPAELGGWFDDGSFARWLRGGHGTIEEIVDDLHCFVDEVTHAHVVRTVEATLSTCSPDSIS